MIDIECNYITPKQIGEHLQIGKDKVYALCQLDGFPAIKIGKSYRINENKYIKWLEKHEGTTINL